MKPFSWVVLGFFLSGISPAQTTAGRCVASAAAAPVRAEGLTERLGDIVLQCTGLTPGSFSGNLTLFLPVAVTNRITAGGLTTDLTVSANGTPLAVAGQVSGQNVLFPGLTFPVPASGAVDLRFSNLRGAVRQMGPPSFGSSIQAQISFTLPLDRAQVAVGFPQRGLLATVAGAGIVCVGSPLPASVTFSNLLAAGTRFTSTRVTEGFGGAFESRASGSDSGTRFLMRFSGFPGGGRVFVPDYVAGSSAAQPTIAGDLGGTPSGGQYVGGSRTLLLARVQGADINGAGGLPVQAPAGTVVLNSVSEVALSGGSGWVVYEAADANASAAENAQIPVFYGIPEGAGGVLAQESLSFAPVSNTFSASPTAPLPRFDGTEPPPDCVNIGDCELIQPILSVSVSPAQLQFTALAGQPAIQVPGYIAVRNAGNGIMQWTASVQYASGSGWITLDPPYTQFVGNASVRVFVSAKNLAAGIYQATVTIDATPDGKQTIPVTLAVAPIPNPNNPNPNPNPNPTPQPKPVTITAVLNGASRLAAPVVSGSLSVITGSNFAGKAVAVTFEGAAAQVYAATDTELQVKVPDLGTKTAAALVVTVDGTASAPQSVPAAPAWPAIFAGGVLNPDNSPNTAGNGAAAGSEIQIFATGLPPSGAGVTVQIHDRKGLIPVYVGVLPQSAVQQVNVLVPADLPAMTTEVVLCAAGGEGQQFCSPGAPLTIR